MSKTSNARKRRRNPPPPNTCRVSQAAAATQTACGTVYRWIRQKQISATKHDGLLYVRLKEVKEARRTRKRSDTYPAPPPEGMVTTRHASNVTGAGQVSIQEWARDGKIETWRPKLRGMWYVNLKDCQRMARESKPGRQ